MTYEDDKNREKEEEIEISLEDLEKVEEPGEIIIEKEDLPEEEYPPVDYPKISSPGASQGKKIDFKKRNKMAMGGGKEFWSLVAAGFIGGLIAWYVTERFFKDYSITQSWVEILIEMGLYASVLGGIIGVCLGSVEGITSRVGEKIIRGALIGLGVGLAGGFAGGFAGQLIYGFLGGGRIDFMPIQILIRGFGWGLVGFFIGLGQGAGAGGGKRIVHGLLGGLMGGAVGGLLFDVLGIVVGGGVLSRAIAMSVLGVCTGGGIGLVQEISKQAWLEVFEGPMAGKQYIIYGNITVVGASPKCDIVLIKDTLISPKHAEIILETNKYIIKDLDSGAGIIVNSRRISQRKLRKGDIIVIGSYKMRFMEK